MPVEGEFADGILLEPRPEQPCIENQLWAQQQGICLQCSAVQCSAVQCVSCQLMGSVLLVKDVMFGFHLMCGLMVIGILVFAFHEGRKVFNARVYQKGKGKLGISVSVRGGSQNLAKLHQSQLLSTCEPSHCHSPIA